MTFYQLAIRYLQRKKVKTLLLFFVFLFVNSMLLSTNMILRATNDSKSILQEKANAKVIAEITNQKNKIEEPEIDKIRTIQEVRLINRVATQVAKSKNFNVILGSEQDDSQNEKVSLYCYDDIRLDSAFSENAYRLIEGELFSESQKGVIINSTLAQFNNLTIGDTLEFETMDGYDTEVNIVGLFLSGSESKQADGLSSVNRIENQIFMDHITFEELFTSISYDRVIVYTSQPTQLVNLQSDMEMIFDGKVELTSSDTLYQQMEAPLNQMSKIMQLMLMLSLVTGIVIISILLCMWMRARKKEIAIFISLGYPKRKMYCQLLLETFLVFFASVVCACVSGSILAEVLQMMLANTNETSVVLQVSIQLGDVISLCWMGSIMVLVAVGGSLWMVLRTKPKDTLSKMEG